jgi:hypothetical protein
MKLLLNNPALRERFGGAGRKRSRLFTADVSVPKFEQIYRQLLDEQSGRTHESQSIPLGQR